MIIVENISYFMLILSVVFLYGYIIKIIYLYIKQIIKEKKLILKKEFFNIVPNTKVKKILFILFILINNALCK